MRETANSQLGIKSLQSMDPFMTANNPVKAESMQTKGHNSVIRYMELKMYAYIFPYI